MPPSRRRPVTPPPRRPRVAGLRRPGPDTPDSPDSLLDPGVDSPDTEVLPRVEPDAVVLDPADDPADDSVDDSVEAPAEPERRKVPSAAPTRRRARVTDEPDSDSGTDSDGAAAVEADSVEAGAVDEDGLAADPYGAEPLPSAESTPSGRRKTPTWVLVTLFAIVVACGAFSIVAGVHLTGVKSADRNTALTDDATTSQVVGQVTNAVNTAFSYNYTNLDKTKQAVQKVLTGKAIGQYNQLFKTVEQQAPAQKLVLTITVQDIGVENLQGDNAHLLVFANETSTKNAAGTKGTQDAAGAMISIDAVRQDGQWKISNINLLT